MPDHHEIVDQIRALLQAVDQTRTPALDALAAAYAQACGDVSRRLARCHRLLQQGLRSEAIQLADIAPRVLDAIADLDFPERADWDELVQMYGLPDAPRFPIEITSFLNEAYAQEDPIQDLLRTHRRLALARAPLRARIGVIRKLTAQDANNPIWQDDLRIFEKARFREIQVEAAEAARRHDAGSVGRLLAELEDQTWSEPPPVVLVQAIRKSDAHFRGQQNRAILADIEVSLNDAFSAHDPIRGRLARDRWRATIAAVKLSPKDAVHERVEPALRWLEDQDRRDEFNRDREDSIRDLVDLLDDPKSVAPAVLDRTANEILKHSDGMPASIQDRFVSRLTLERARQTRRRQWAAAAAAVAAVVVVSAVGAGIRSQSRARDSARAATALSDMLELGEHGQAVEFLERLTKADPSLFEYPGLANARALVQGAQEKEAQRQIQFDQAIRQVEQAPVTEADPTALETARGLARLSTEKTLLDQLLQRRGAAHREDRDRRERELAPRLSALSANIEVIRLKLEKAKSDGQEASASLKELVQTQAELRGLGTEIDHVGDEQQKAFRVLSLKLDAMRAEQEGRKQRRRLEEQMTSAVAYSADDEPRDLDAYTELIQKYIKNYPDSPRSRAMAKVEPERAIWQTITKENRLLASWQVPESTATSEQLSARAAACKTFLAENPNDPSALRLTEYQAHLEAMARRDLRVDNPRNRLKQLFSDILIDSVWVVKVKNPPSRPKSYFLTKQPSEDSNLLRYISGFDGRERAKPIVKANIIYSSVSPQTKIGVRYKAIFSRAAMIPDWDKVMFDLLTEIRKDAEMDPILKLTLLKKVTEYAMQGSVPLQAALAPLKAVMEQSDVDLNVPWMDPESVDAGRLRLTAERVVESMPDSLEMLREARVQEHRIEQIITLTYRSVGWLAQEDSTWGLRSGSVLPNEGELWVAVPEGSPRTAWKKLGKINSGKVSVAPESLDVRAEGRPVFVTVNAVPKV
ncbi:hypothetical protein [Paludisphaera borealis]|uniref:Uncharacterized protein n=1 Tax=Paludisphaera borealis TaxID=1387353 RepID=A0A1U7CMH3_9BACT|nr:hypothetical protein [Paludisphaera borealis]APW60108.1 hypothetical protein BSF38_01572 [Paludisphaera borealis]